MNFNSSDHVSFGEAQNIINIWSEEMRLIPDSGHQFETETMFWTYVCVSSLLTLVTVRASECGLITITGRHPGKHARQITSPPMGACHHVACAPWTPIWVTMKYRGNIKKEEFLSKHYFPLLFFTLSRLSLLKIVQV